MRIIQLKSQYKHQKRFEVYIYFFSLGNNSDYCSWFYNQRIQFKKILNTSFTHFYFEVFSYFPPMCFGSHTAHVLVLFRDAFEVSLTQQIDKIVPLKKFLLL